MTHPLRILGAAAVLVLTRLESVGAAVVVSNVSLTANSITFDLAGTLDGPSPTWFDQQIFVTASTGAFMLDGVRTGTAVTFSTTNSNDLFDFYTIDQARRYPFTLATAADSSYAIGDDVTGTYTATWIDDQFDPSGGATLDFHWGAADRFGTNPPTGTPIALGVAIPEPTTSLLSASGFLALLGRRRRNQRADQGVADRRLTAALFRSVSAVRSPSFFATRGLVFARLH